MEWKIEEEEKEENVHTFVYPIVSFRSNVPESWIVSSDRGKFDYSIRSRISLETKARARFISRLLKSPFFCPLQLDTDVKIGC